MGWGEKSRNNHLIGVYVGKNCQQESPPFFFFVAEWRNTNPLQPTFPPANSIFFYFDPQGDAPECISPTINHFHYFEQGFQLVFCSYNNPNCNKFQKLIYSQNIKF